MTGQALRFTKLSFALLCVGALGACSKADNAADTAAARTDSAAGRVDSAATAMANTAGSWTNDRIFGFAGTPSGGSDDLAQLVDISAHVPVTARLTIYAYYGHAFGDRAIENTFAGEDADYGYMDVVFRW